MKLNRIIIAGGGTGGHLFPGIAIAEDFLSRSGQNQVLFVSTANPFEIKTLKRLDLPLAKISAEGFKGRRPWHKLKSLVKIPLGILESLRILRGFKPQIVVGVGSYSSAALVMAARFARIKIVLHEQNILPGITNRLLARFADRIYVSFAETEFKVPRDRISLSGNPIRRQLIEEAQRTNGLSDPSRKKSGFTILIAGGSQGAHAINVAVIESLPLIPNPQALRFIHQTGQADVAMVQKGYLAAGITAEVKPFFNDMGWCYAQADLIICRSGATTVAEITALGKAALFIPFPHAADNHQVLNARSLVNSQAAEMILQADLSGATLAERIEYYAATPEALDRMGGNAHKRGCPQAARAIIKDCCRLLAGD